MPVDLRPRNVGDRRPWCVHHGLACQLGAQPLTELTVMVLQAKHDLGQPVPPIDQHRPATPGERRRAERDVAAAIALVRASNERQLAEILGDEPEVHLDQAQP